MENKKSFAIAPIAMRKIADLLVGVESTIPTSIYKSLCMEFAKIDDEICRNELEGNFVDGKEIVFPPKVSLQYRYELFLEMYEDYGYQDFKRERKRLRERLVESYQYIGQEKTELDIEFG